MAHRRAAAARQKGGAAVEFAIVLPFFAVVLFGMIDYGWYYYARFSLAAALRDGLRYGVTMTAGNSLPYSSAKARCLADLVASNVSTGSITWGPTTPVQGSVPNQTLTLSVSMPFVPLVGFVPTPKSLSGSMTMLLELQ